MELQTEVMLKKIIKSYRSENFIIVKTRITQASKMYKKTANFNGYFSLVLFSASLIDNFP